MLLLKSSILKRFDLYIDFYCNGAYSISLKQFCIYRPSAFGFGNDSSRLLRKPKFYVQLSDFCITGFSFSAIPGLTLAYWFYVMVVH